MSLVTTCPSCGTIFRMVREQLEASEGRVRCGHCMEVFDAKSQLQAAPLESPAETPLSTDSQTEVGQSHFSFVKQARQQAFWSQPGVRAGLMLMSFVLLAAMLVQIARAEHDRFASPDTPLASTVQKLCYWWTCEPTARRNIEAWQIDNTSFQKEASKANAGAFRLSLQVKNTATTPLLLPHLELSLLDASDTLLVRKVINLDGLDATQSVVVTGFEERRFQLLVTTNAAGAQVARDVVGYRAVLFYP